MAEVVGGFLMPHNPMLAMARDVADRAQTKVVFDAFETIVQRVKDLNADTVIVIGDDHYTNFGPHCIPAYLIAIGDVEGPVEPFLGIERSPIENNVPLANHILKTGYGEGIDWAYAKALTVDHSVAIPYHLAVRDVPGLKTIPVYLNAGVDPLLPSRRAFQVGQSIRRAIESWEGDERVVVYGTGGISHWVGSTGMGRVNAELDQRILDMCVAGDVDGLIAMPDEMVEAEGGNGCLEIKNWICAMGAMPGAKADVIAYEAMQAWITGMGFAELKTAA
ncbi:DODA-type extradiol aromatic ring-opening family dioxygenase [Novosphingobium malaysiense]|uniref:Protocatechuate 3,4-dioxygenase n=1 Tax=Novosphingobium malaysiense TaxID=1348853 RepID=A0A0B1ZP54_9SPHN|nr:protocatechuate 3,4-dioxygenase [Novosphingobium malaysiense]KHK92940.1 protocatechuate 3,4-dioxygenase [Novosphingobium malaysiense]